jgi:hypothetical protein
LSPEKPLLRPAIQMPSLSGCAWTGQVIPLHWTSLRGNRLNCPTLKALALFIAFSAPGACLRTREAALNNGRWSLPSTEAPLGPTGLAQTVTERTVTSGITYYQIRRGVSDPSAYWTVNIGFFRTRAMAHAQVHNLSHFGVTARVDPSAGKNESGHVLGYWVSAGKYASQSDATASAAQIARTTHNKYRPAIRNTTLAGYPTTGPWIINILAIRPAETVAKLAIVPAGDDNLGANGETVSAAAARIGALAGTNGGFFTNINPFPAEHTLRSPVGATVINGNLIATATSKRPGVKIEKTEDGHFKIGILHEMTTRITVSDAEKRAMPITAIDRPILGTVVNCGTPAESPTRKPAHDYPCTNYNDLVLYDGLYLRGKASNNHVDPHYHGPVYELLVDRTGSVVEGHTTLGAAPPNGGYVLQGLGRNARWLWMHAEPGTKLHIKKRLFAGGEEIPLSRNVSVIEGGPTLSATNLTATAAEEGFGSAMNGLDIGDSAGTVHDSWYNGWYVARNPRTALGIAGDGTILLVEIAGRQPDVSLGASIPELAAMMRWLGATTAINLDGGGSSNMVVGGAAVGHPSDPAGERGVGDTLMILPR